MKTKLMSLLILITVLMTLKFKFYPSLSGISLEGVQKVNELPSPDNHYKLNIYLYGGVLLKWDYSYIAELEDLTNYKKKNILWLPPELPEIRWLDDNTLLVNEEEVNITKDTFDFRWD
ncbi:DUF5412 family protein [Neobacillus sp. D3-1R]|uniref:DUF5412 family protein n=1 Tax=Neobacillus sp. D3-1R TaxID=3445778 RepID=UPI003FA07E5A